MEAYKEAMVQSKADSRARGRSAQDERELRRRRQTQLLYRAAAKEKRRAGILVRILAVLVILNLLLLCCSFFHVRSLDKRIVSAAERMQTAADENEGEGSLGTYQAAPDSQSVTEGVVQQAIAENSYADLWGLPLVDRPQSRTREQVTERLLELSGDSGTIAEICQDFSRYPDKLLEALANNPEMAGFVSGYPEAEKKAAGGLTEGEKEQEFPLLLQWDPRWGYAEYGDESNIGLSGCGPTCISMVLFYLTRDESLTPDRIAEYSMNNGYYLAGTGTRWALMEDVPKKYGLEVAQPGADEKTAKSALDEGCVIICSMAPGDFTAGGHFIVIYGYDPEGFLVNDPNCVARSRQHWTWSTLENQIKNVWVYSSTL